MSSSTAATKPWDLGLGIDQAAQARIHALVVEHFDAVWRLLRRLGVGEAVVDDAAQRVFLTATKKLSQIQVESEQSFLFGVALRVAADERRKVRRRGEVDGADVPGALVDDRPAPDELVEQRKARALMDHVLETMQPELRSVFVLYEMEELTMAEIASMLGIPPGSVASRLRRAREHFHDYIRRYRAKWERRKVKP